MMLEKTIVVSGLNHKSASIQLRESVSFSGNRLKDALRRILALNAIDECVLLSTCNRVEIYAVTEKLTDAREQLIRFLESYHGLSVESNFRESLYFYTKDKAIEHLFSVSSGLDSMVIGETQILGQVKAAYSVAHETAATRSLLNMLFQRSLRVAKKVRLSTNISRGCVSVSSVAVELANKALGSLKDAVVMIIGAGKIGELTARSLASYGTRSTLVSNRDYDKALKLASLSGLEAIKFDDIENRLIEADIVIVSTAAPHYVIKEGLMERVMGLREARPILLIDISVPRNIDPRVSRLKNAFLYNIDDLNSLANANLKERMQEINSCQTIIGTETEHFCSYLKNYTARAKSLCCSPPLSKDFS